MEIIQFINKMKSFAQSTPDKVMFVEENATRKVTYSEFWIMAQKIANALKQHLGQSQRQFIPIYLPDSMKYIAAETAIWMTGNAAVHTGLSFPKARIDYIVAQTEAPLIIDTAFVNEALQCKPDAEIVQRTSDMPCAMFYTSGSTGNPKGILHSDASFLTNARCFVSEIKMNQYKTFSSIAPFYFIAVAVYCHVIVEKGVELHLLPIETRRNVTKLQDYIADNHIEATFISPSILQVYHNKAKSLKLIITGSERLVGCHSDEYTILNTFGQTETSAVFIWTKIDKNYDNSPIGKPIEGLEVGLFDDNGKEVPDGEPGELCIKSGYVSPVYFKDPEGTAKLTKGGVQHTGDLIKRLPNGDLLYVQRKDWMVKINGQRVEPGEIENAMKHIEGIANAIVKGFTTDDLSRQYLVGYYIATPDAEHVDDDYITAELKKTLPTYMVPQYMVRMEEFPLNANFKIDRKSLKSPAVSPRQNKYVAPENDLQKALCDIFGRILDIDKVGIDDDFVVLGGDSIRSMKLQQIFNEEYTDKKWGILSTSIINMGRTPRKIAELIANSQNFDFVEQEDYPLYSSQMNYILSSLAAPDKPIGVLVRAFQLDRAINMNKLARSIETVAAAHKAFGIRIFKDDKSELRQKYDATPITISIESMDDTLLKEAVEKLSKPIKILNSPLYRIRLIVTQNGKYLLTMFHHSIFDGSSQKVLTRDLSLAYAGQPLHQEIWSQFHVAVGEQQYRNSEKHAEAIQWFKDKLGNAPVNVFPIPDKNDVEISGKRLKIILNVTPSEMKKAAQKMGCTLNVYTTTIFTRLLNKYAESKNNVTVWLPFAAREDYRTENTIGQLVCGFVLNTAWSKDTPLQTQIKDVNDYVVTAMSYAHADKKSVTPKGAIMPFLYQGEKEKWSIDGKNILDIQGIEAPYSGSVPMIVHLSINKTSEIPNGKVTVFIEYLSSKYSDNYIQQMMNDFSEMLKSAK